MKRTSLILLLAAAAAVPMAAQIQFDLQNVAAKASGTVDISLDSAMLKMASSFFSGNKSQDNADVQQLVSGLKNITVKSYTFAQEGAYRDSDLNSARTQLRNAGWNHMIGVHESGKEGSTDIFSKSQAGKIAGIAVIAEEPKELTVVYIEGSIDLNKLAGLAGHFGIPQLPIPGQKPPAKGNDQ